MNLTIPAAARSVIHTIRSMRVCGMGAGRVDGWTDGLMNFNPATQGDLSWASKGKGRIKRRQRQSKKLKLETGLGVESVAPRTDLRFVKHFCVLCHV